MRSSLILPLGLVFAGLVGCGAKKGPATVPVTSTPTKNAPSWIDNEEIPDGLAAVGIAQPNPMGDKSMQRTVAIADARTKLAGTSTRAFWTDPADGNLYVFVVMTKDTMDRAMAGAAQAQIKKEIAQGEQSLDKALDKLDAAIAASANPA